MAEEGEVVVEVKMLRVVLQERSLLRNLRPFKHDIHAKMGNNQHDVLVERRTNWSSFKRPR